MNEVKFKNKKANKNKLVAFGFEEKDGGYAYFTELAESQMKMAVTLSPEGQVFCEVSDGNGEEYVLHLVESAAGSFVGQVKAEYEAVIEEIFEKCFDADVFKSDYAKKVIAYAWEKYGDEPEYLWQKFPDNAVLRRKDTGKWYAALLTVSKRKLGIDSDEMVEIIDLRIKPEDLEALIDNEKYFPGYHMNKKHWYTICLNGTVAIEEICNRIDLSYGIAVK